jgi:hypothetical protein
MISSEVERTLVKSPPELWAELSDPASLARHLGKLGDIRITRVQPEESVEWQARDTSGTISIKPSGWGTTVKLTAVRELGDSQPRPEPEAPPEAGSGEKPELVAQPDPPPAPEPRPAPDAPAAEAGAADAPAVEANAVEELEALTPPPRRRGFFARLFARRPRPAETQASAEATPPSPVPDEPPLAPEAPPSATTPASDPFVTVRSVLAPETFTGAHLFAPVPPRTTAEISTPDLSAELLEAEDVEAEEVAVEEMTAVLTAVLDRLGAAHHRPFSRA